MTANTTDCVLSLLGKSVTISLTGFEENYNKTLNKADGTTATSVQKRDINNPLKVIKYIDVGLAKELRWEITGTIQTNYGSATNERSDVWDKLSDLYAMFFVGGAINMTLHGESYTIFTDKMNISYKASDETAITTLDVKFTAVYGQDVFSG
jgi:hypothetical protein